MNWSPADDARIEDALYELHQEQALDAWYELEAETIEEAHREAGAWDDFPFGLEPIELAMPFCACGRVFSRCDGSRKGCRK